MKHVISIVMFALCAHTSMVVAQGLGQETPTSQLNKLVVDGDEAGVEGSSTSPSVKQAKETLKNVPGGVGFVETEEYEDQFIQSLGDTLVFTPGVYADTSAQRESRISIRGSGLNATFERRGIIVYRDNVPISRASGITEFQEVDPISIKYLEVLKGANAARLGATSLGGAINAVTPTGQNTEEGTKLRIEGGSFGTSRFNINTAGKQGNTDYYASLTKLDSDGYRAHSDVNSLYGFANIGFTLSDRVETRFYFTSVDDRFELASSVPLNDALNNPETAVRTITYPFFLGGATFSAIDDDWDRNLRVNRLSNKTTLTFDKAQLELGAWASERHLDHAITRFAGIIDQEDDELGLSAKLSNRTTSDNAMKWVLGVTANGSRNQARAWNNVLGERTTQRSNDIQNAENTSVYGQLDIPLSDNLRLITGGLYGYSLREEEGTGRLTFEEFSPNLGLLWNVNKNYQWYTNLSQSYEPPGISDLTSGGAGAFDPLLAQKAVTFEIGTRGQSDFTAWDISLYRSIVENEFIDTEDPTSPGSTITTNSQSDTIHQGLEAGFDIYPQINALDNAGLSLGWLNSLTINDFQFDNNPTYSNNTLAGVPDVIYITELRLDSVDNWYTGLNVRHIPDGPYVDFSNTTQVDGYTLYGLTAGWDITSGFRIFSSIENLTDERYVSNVSTVFSGSATDALFTPGQGRAFYIGFSIDL